MTSLPYQTLLMKVRHISRWDNSMETGMWLGAYMLFWAVGQLGGAAVSLRKPFPDKRKAWCQQSTN